MPPARRRSKGSKLILCGPLEFACFDKGSCSYFRIDADEELCSTCNAVLSQIDSLTNVRHGEVWNYMFALSAGRLLQTDRSPEAAMSLWIPWTD